MIDRFGQRQVTFIIEDVPTSGVSGYCTYNRNLLDALIEAGIKVNLIVTGSRFPSFFYSNEDVLGARSDLLKIYFLHRTSMLGTTIPAGLGSLMRALYGLVRSKLSWAYRLIQSTRTAKGNTAHIGRFLTEIEKSRISKILNQGESRVVFVDTIFRTPRIETPHSRRLVLVAHDVFNERCTSLQDRGIKPIPFITKPMELDLVAHFDDILAITEHDASSLAALNKKAFVGVIYPTSPVRTKSNSAANLPKFLYIGSSAPHNVDGLRWFLSKVWPIAKTIIPDMHLDVIGNIGDAIHTEEIPLDVTFHGRVEFVDPIASRCLAAINPVLAGSGMKVKMIDYFSFGLPCLTTTLGMQGFPASDASPILCADDPHEMATMLGELVKNAARTAQLQKFAAAYAELFSSNPFSKYIKDQLQLEA